MKTNPLFLAIGLLTGTIIGAGIFALPYLFKTAGLLTGFFYLALGSVVYITVYGLYADVILRTAGEHRFVGYARRYLGRVPAAFSILMTIVETILVLTIYLILSLSFSRLIFPADQGISMLIIFWVIGSLSIFWGERRIAAYELLVTIGIVAIIVIVFLFGVPALDQLQAGDWSPQASWWLLPLAPVLFALSGRVAVPPLIKILKDRRAIIKAISIGTILSAVVYALFAVSIIALSPAVSKDAVSGLVGVVPGIVLALIGAFGLLSLLSSYTTIGFDINKSLTLDLKLSGGLRILLVVVAPLALYFAGLQDFIVLIGFVGGIFLALESLFIIWMWQRANETSKNGPLLVSRNNTFLVGISMIVFVAALIYEFVK